MAKLEKRSKSQKYYGIPDRVIATFKKNEPKQQCWTQLPHILIHPDERVNLRLLLGVTGAGPILYVDPLVVALIININAYSIVSLTLQSIELDYIYSQISTF